MLSSLPHVCFNRGRVLESQASGRLPAQLRGHRVLYGVCRTAVSRSILGRIMTTPGLLLHTGYGNKCQPKSPNPSSLDYATVASTQNCRPVSTCTSCANPGTSRSMLPRFLVKRFMVKLLCRMYGRHSCLEAPCKL